MPWTLERLRLAIMALAAVLLLAILGFFFYGRWRLRHIGQDLPARLGVQIQQSTQGFVFSKTEQGRTVFTLHAARAVEFKSGGRLLLHDVEIDVYNQDGKADTIAGKDFQYDPHSQIVVSQGEAHIVLHPPTKTSSGTLNKDAAQPIRITTHGLVFNQKTGVATCSGEVDFQVADSSGQAMGAEYDSRQGHLLLQSQVVLTTAMQGRPAVMHAIQAIYDREANLVHLIEPRYSSRMQQGTEQGAAGVATVFLRRDGSAERLDAQNGVQLASSDGTTVHGATMEALLNASSQPQQVHFAGDVKFTQNQPQQKTFGSAQDATVDFDAHGHVHRAVFDRAVEMHQQADGEENPVRRTLRANHLVLRLLPAKKGHSQLQTADATGNAVFTSQSTLPGRSAQSTTVSAQVLKATFLPGNLIQHIDGAGQTRLATIAANGNVDTSTGDTLSVDFAVNQPPSVHPPPLQKQAAASAANSLSSTQSIRSAVQTGHVVLQQTASAKKEGASSRQLSTATAERAEYVASTDMLTLMGNPVFRDAQLEMAAHRMQVHRATGDMVATGAVLATLRSGGTAAGTQSGGMLGGNQPAHIIAQRATLIHSAQKAVFSGQARLWQGGDTIEAPVIEVSQKMQTLQAYGDAACAQCVHSTLITQANPAPTHPRSTAVLAHSSQSASAKNSGPSVFRILSGRLLYSDAERKASFESHVEVISPSGQIFADNAEIYLTPSVAGHAEKEKSLSSLSSGRNNPPQSSVERVVATGDVRLMQPGRQGTGAKLVYTASDGRFVLTGDDGRPPEIVDADRGTVSGEVLTFLSQQQEILVNGSPAHTTTIVTRVKKR